METTRCSYSRHGAAALLVGLALASSAGCNQSSETHLRARTWTLFEIQAAFKANGNVAMGQTLPAGMPASGLLATVDGADRLVTIPCYGEGQPCGYVTTELRVNVDTLLIQPLYAQVTAGADGSLTPIAGAPLILDVGPGSNFYSPFWELNYAVVPAGTDPDHFHSTRQLFAEHAVIKPVAPHTCPLRPLDLLLSTDGLQDAGPAEGVIDGAHAGAFDFGPDNFTVGPDGVIEELPFFKFVKPGDDAFSAPNVAAVGPLFSGRPADVLHDAVTGRPYPRFGASWRIFAALLPATARAFHQADFTADQLTALGMQPGVVLADYEGRVALGGDCFADPTMFPASCNWLDSQASIEARLGAANLIKTEITGVCPLVKWEGKAVKRP